MRSARLERFLDGETRQAAGRTTAEPRRDSDPVARFQLTGHLLSGLPGLGPCLRTPGADRCGAPHGFYFFPYSSSPLKLKVRGTLPGPRCRLVIRQAISVCGSPAMLLLWYRFRSAGIGSVMCSLFFAFCTQPIIFSLGYTSL